MEKTSVLGDDYYSPMVADRVLSLCNMFLGEKVISLETLVSRLGLSEETIKVGNFVLKKDYENSMLESTIAHGHAREKIRQLESSLGSLRFRVLESENKLTVLEKERLQERHVERILVSILQIFDTELVTDGETPWVLKLTKIDNAVYLFLNNLSENIDNVLRGLLSNRLRASNEIDQMLLNDTLFTKRNKITLAEKIEKYQLTRAQTSELRHRQTNI